MRAVGATAVAEPEPATPFGPSVSGSVPFQSQGALFYVQPQAAAEEVPEVTEEEEDILRSPQSPEHVEASPE
eukprot:6356615-Lingulodinium_polyedra.AAC.1